jgi:TonB family protein
MPRYAVQAPLDVTMLRSGIPDTVPGRSLNLCERGLGAVLAGEMIPGETVGVEVHLPTASEPLRTRALVRYQDQLRCGLEFVGLSSAQQAAIRDWAELSKATAEPEPGLGKAGLAKLAPVAGKGSEHEKPDASGLRGSGGPHGPGGPGEPSKKRRGAWIGLVIVLAILGAAFWWRWNRGWEELESGLPNHAAKRDAPEVTSPQVQVPADEMQKLLIHKVDPEYPAAARQEKLQGVIVLDVVVGRDGTVLETRALNGPDVLAQAAMEALRWWKFEPYSVQGKPAVVETTVAVEFKL